MRFGRTWAMQKRYTWVQVLPVLKCFFKEGYSGALCRKGVSFPDVR